MSNDSAIEWCDATWNPVIGCSHASAGCDHCYAEGQVHRFGGRYDKPTTIKLGANKKSGLTWLPTDPTTDKTLGKGAKWTGAVWLLPEVLALPLRRRKPTTYFVNSLSDWAHESIVESEQGRRFLAAMFGVMAACPQHTFQLLTKRPEQARRWFEWLDSVAPKSRRHTYGTACAFEFVDSASKRKMSQTLAEHESWPLPNVWIGASVEDQTTADERVPALLELPAAVRFLSAEPLLGPIKLKRWLMQGVDPGRCLNCGGGHGFDRCPNYGGVSMSDDRTGCTSFRRKNFAIDLVIVGGESGAKARPCDVDWIRDVVGQCKRAGVHAFCKQLGTRSTIFVSDAKGSTMSEWPEDLRVREMPTR